MKYILYKEYLKKHKIYNEEIFVSKIFDGYLIGPKINTVFDEYSFYKRIISSSIYSRNKYKSCLKRTANKLIKKYAEDLKDNEIIEVLKSGEEVRHKIIPVPGGKYNEEQVSCQ